MIANNLNENQYKAVYHKEGPLLIIAGAGSGKTKTLTERICHLINQGIPEKNILGITFTNKAAREMRHRVNKALKRDIDHKNEMFLGTFHSWGSLFLRKECRYLDRNSNFTIFDSDDTTSLLKKILKDEGITLKNNQKPANILSKFSQIKSELKLDSDELINHLFQIYEKNLQKNNAFDFDDLIEKPQILLSQNKEVKEKYENKYSYILVDEFQDTNTAQYRLVRLLGQKSGNVNVVGDDAQSIYSWRYADFRNFLNFEQDWPNTTVIKLEENYRSKGNILEAANILISKNTIQKKKSLWTRQEKGEKIHLISTQGEKQESNYVTSEIKKKIREGIKLEDVAILYRTNSQSRSIEQSLIESGVEYHIVGGTRFYDRKEIKDIIAALRFASNLNDEISLTRLEKNIGKRESAKLKERYQKNSTSLLSQKTSEIIKNFLDSTNYLEKLHKEDNFEDRMDNIKELIRFAENESDISKFLETASLMDAHEQSSSKGVNLLTLHLSKGLEYPYVFIIGCNEGNIPHERSLKDKMNIEEERRLFYVGITRAKEVLYISFNNLPSRFIAELPQNILDWQSIGDPFQNSSYSNNNIRNKRNNFNDFDEDSWLEYD